MTGGADVLFPGGSQLVRLAGDRAAVDALVEAGAADPPVFAFATVDAWGSELGTGTLAVIDEMKVAAGGEDATVLCSGLGRWRWQRGGGDGEGGNDAVVAELWDEPPAEEDEEELAALEQSVVKSLTELVRLSIKVAGEDSGMEVALAESMKRIEALCARVEEEARGGAPPSAVDDGGDDGASMLMLQHWVDLRADANRRRELLGFITVDMMNLSYMARAGLLESTDTKLRLRQAKDALEPFLKELAAKAAIVSALGNTADPDADLPATE